VAALAQAGAVGGGMGLRGWRAQCGTARRRGSAGKCSRGRNTMGGRWGQRWTMRRRPEGCASEVGWWSLGEEDEFVVLGLSQIQQV